MFGSCAIAAGSEIFQTRCVTPYFVFQLTDRLAGRDLIQHPVDGKLRIGIQHEDLAEVGVRMAQQFHAIFFRTGERLFMAMDHAGGIIFHRAQTDEPLPLQSLVAVWRRKLLKIRVNTGFALMFQNAAADPIREQACCASVGVVAFVIFGLPLARE